MSGFYLALIATLLAGIGARDQVALAQLVRAQGTRPMALATGIIACIASAALAAWAAGLVLPMLMPRARTVLAAMALAFAGAELLVFAPARRAPAEPTRSLAALGVVLVMHQLTDAARFLVFAVAVATAAPVPAGIAGALAGAVLLTAAWLAPDAVLHPAARHARRGVGAVLLVASVLVALSAFGRL